MNLRPSPKKRVLLLLLVAPLFLTACSISDLPGIGRFFKKQTAAPVTITVWGLWNPKEIMGVLIEGYKKDNPTTTIEYEQRSFASLKSYKEAVTTRLAEGSAPDVVLVHNSWMPEIFANLSPAPSDAFTQEAFDSSFYSIAKEYGVFDGKVYAVPLNHDGLALVYNRDMFTEAGLSTPPTTWEEFRVSASKLTKRDEKAGTIAQAGAAIGAANNIEHFSDILGLLFSQGDIQVPEDISTQAAADAFSFYINFVKQEKIWSDILPSSVEAFADKKVAMIFVPSWELINVLSRSSQVNIGVAPAPRALSLQGEKINIDWGSFWMFAVSKNSSKPNEAWSFLKYMTAQEQQRTLYDQQSRAWGLGAPYSLKSLQGELSSSAYLDPFVKTGDMAKSGILAGRSGNDKETDALKTAINSVLSGTSEPAEALAKFKKDLTGN